MWYTIPYPPLPMMFCSVIDETMLDSVKLSLSKEMSFHELTNPCFLFLLNLINKSDSKRVSNKATITKLVTKPTDQDEPLFFLWRPDLHKVRFSVGVSAQRLELPKKLLANTKISNSLGILPIKWLMTITWFRFQSHECKYMPQTCWQVAGRKVVLIIN